MNRPDFSNYVAHFTKDKDPYYKKYHPQAQLKGEISGSAFERLLSILKSKTIYSTIMPWSKMKAVCFTECPWTSFHSHAQEYSCYGLGFKKETLFKVGGGPVHYMRTDVFQKQFEQIGAGKHFCEELYTFIAPFAPAYAPPEYFESEWVKKVVDYSHEREWRVPTDYSFEYNQIEFVVVQSFQDLNHIPPEIVEAIGIDRFLPMGTYKQIESLWPTNLGRI